MRMCSEIRVLTETFFIDNESCVFTFDGLNLQWRDKLVSVKNFVAIDFLHSGNCCSEKRSKLFFFRKLPHKCEGHDTMVLRYADSQKKNRLKLTSLKIRGEEKQLTKWLRVLRCSLDTERKDRAKKYLVFINPFSGRQNGVEVYMKKVKPLFDAAGIGTTIIITKSRSDYGKIINMGIEEYDAILAVGGDGTVSEIVNSLIISQMEICLPNAEVEASVPKVNIPIGIIPCGSTDCVAYTLNGTRDTETNALHAILGNRTYFDVCRAISQTGEDRFFISVFTYGYLSDLLRESEKFRWMGPMRYNYAGLLTLLRSKEYYGQVDMVGTQFGKKTTSDMSIQKDNMELQKKLMKKNSNNLSLSLLPIVPIVEPGSEFIHTPMICRHMVRRNESQCGGDVPETENNMEINEKESEECEPSTSEEKGDEDGVAFASLVRNRSCENLVPFRMEITPVLGNQPKEIHIRGRYFLIACANISCSSELTPNGIAPNCVTGDGNMNVALFQPNSICDLYKMYARLTSRGKGYLLTDLPFINIYQTKRVKIGVTQKNIEQRNYANCDGELFHDSLVDIRIHESIIQFYTRR